MVHLTNTSRSATFLLGTAMLMLFLFCAPMHAQTPTFKSTSSYKIANPNYSAQQLDPTTIGHQTYRSTIYTPFGSSTPSSNNPSGNSGSGGSGDPDDDVGIPGWADTPSEPLPIGDGMGILLLMATMMVGAIFLKQRKQLSEFISKSTTSTTNINNLRGNQLPTALKKENNTTQHMTTRKQTYQSFFQKLFLLLAFVCIAGQVSAKVVYFRPSTILVGPSGTDAKDATAWAKETSDCWFPMLKVSNYESSSRVKHMDQYEDNYISNAIYAGTETSRFLGYTVDSNTDGFAFYRVNDKNGAVYSDYWSIPTEKTVGSGVYDCVPNNKWWGQGETYHTFMFTLSNIGETHNLIGMYEGTWGSENNGYYLAFYVENDVYLYFANTNNWDKPTFARGKDVYSYKENADRITGTRLYYTKLAGKSGIAYRKYAYIDDSTGSWTEIEDLWKKYQTTVATQATIDANKLDTRISSFTKRSNSVDDIRLDNTSTGTTHLIIPSSTSNITDLTRTAHSSYTELNYTLTVKTYSAVKHTANTSPTYANNTDGGTITYSAYKLSGQGKSTKGTGSSTTASTAITAAYTGEIVLTAVPKTGYKFVGWYSSTGDLLSTDLEWTTEKTKGNTTIHARFMSYNKQIRMQTYGYDQKSQTYKWLDVADGGKKITITYNDGTGNKTEEKTTADTLNIYPQEGTTVQLSAVAKDNYTFVGWWNNNGQRYDNNPWSFLPEETNQSITARFAPSRQQTINVHTYDKEQDTYVLSGNGGSVNIAYTQLTTTVNDGYTTTNTDVTTQGTYTTLYNTTYTLSATPKTGYKFLGWFDSNGNQIEWTKQYEKAIECKADYSANITARFCEEFTQKFDVQTNISGTYQNSTTGGTATISYNDGTKTAEIGSSTLSIEDMYQGSMNTLTATPKDGYRFVGWFQNDGTCWTENPYTYRAEGSRTVHARFAPNNITLSVAVLNYNPEYDKFEEYGYEYNTITLKQGNNKLAESYSSFKHKFDSETTVTLTATPEDGEDGYDFVGWYINNEKLTQKGSNSLYTLASDDSKVLTINLSGAVAVDARFAPKKCYYLEIRNNIGGTFTVRHSKNEQFNPASTTESALDQYVYTYIPYGGVWIDVPHTKPILGYEFKGSKVLSHGGNIPVGGKFNYTWENHTQIAANFVRKDDQVVYLNLNGLSAIPNTWLPGTGETTTYYAYVYNTLTGEQLWIEMTQVEDKCYTCTIPGGKYNRLNFVHSTNLELDQITNFTITDLKNSGKEKRRSDFLTIPATRYNCYRIRGVYSSNTGSGKEGYVDGWVAPPTQTGDYRLIYIEQEVASKTEINRTYEFNEGDRIKKIASGTKTDIVSLHIYNKVSKDNNGNLTGTALNNPEIILQQWDGTTWVDIERYMVFGPLQTDNTDHVRMPGRKNTVQVVVDKGIDNIKKEKADASKDYGCGVWNFVIEQNGTTARLVIDQTHRYEGTYYIRTPNADGQYHNFTHPGNILSYSEYAKNNSDYSHYFIRYVDIYEDGTPTAEAGKHPVVKFCIANDYAINLCKEFTNTQNRFEPEEDIYVLNAGDLPADATVRFGWDIKTNRLTRAYIANTFHKNNEYLVVEGDNIGTPTGDATYFTDNSNWLYSIDLPDATAGAKAKVKAKMNGQYQYFMGSQDDDDYETLISGNGAGTYPIRLLYDFKDDRFTTIYRPESGTINNDVELSTPLMIERKHNEPATQIQLETNKKITTVKAGKDQYTQPAYAVMTFLESVLADASKTHHEKMFYWISFPFDVKISDVFGLGEYGKYWIMEEYDGAQRAAHGLAQSNWKYITKKSAVLSKNVGYVLCLNYSQILQDQLFKSYGSSDQELNSGKLSLYFPSNGIVDPKSIVGGQNATIDLAEYYNANTAWNHHNWHIIGVPSFANPGTIDEQQDAPFVYQYWHPGDAYAAVSINDVEFQSMHAYMVQYAGEIKWTNKIVNTGGNVSGGKSLAAQKDADADKKIMLRLELQQAGSTLDKTYVQLRNDKGTKGFDMSLDLTKIINAGANIYSIVDNHEMAGNAMPKDETVLPLGVVITAAGEYTFAMPNGTEGMIVELIDYEQGTSTNLLMSDYTVTLDKGTFNQRFALRLKPDKVATSVDNIGNEANGDEVRKLLIDGVLYLVKDGAVYDAQGHCVR